SEDTTMWTYHPVVLDGAIQTAGRVVYHFAEHEVIVPFHLTNTFKVTTVKNICNMIAKADAEYSASMWLFPPNNNGCAIILKGFTTRPMLQESNLDATAVTDGIVYRHSWRTSTLYGWEEDHIDQVHVLAMILKRGMSQGYHKTGISSFISVIPQQSNLGVTKSDFAISVNSAFAISQKSAQSSWFTFPQ
ncbi:MAG: hypothetical protein GY737_08160, partial [Desulfobacteraceae bacterium]|nr:hypothetical protein [Desulfobacteraceae bacterium]